MIKIEIINSPDMDAQGVYQFELDHFTMGSHKKDNLIIHDKKIKSHHIKFEINENDLFIDSNIENYYFLNSQKKVYGRKKFKKDSLFQIGDTKIKILDFSQTTKSQDPEAFAQNLENISHDPLLKEIINNLEDEISQLSEEKYTKEQLS